MTILSFQDVHKAFGPDVVFRGLNLNFYAGQKVGLIGPNGSGKTTLFRMILGIESPDQGVLTRNKDLKIGYLPQEPLFDKRHTVMEEMHDGMAELLALHSKIDEFCHQMESLTGAALTAAMAEYDRLCHRFETEGGYAYEARIKSILAGLDIGPEHYNTPTGALSGGQLSRLGLAKVLVRQTNLLLLDEPTNHLDLQATAWLESFLRAYSGSVILISHDRYLLDQVAEKIVELDNFKARVWKGNYTRYVETRETVALTEGREHEKRKEMVEKTQDFIARNINQKGVQAMARGRRTRLERLLKDNPDYLETGKASRTIHFSFKPTQVRSDWVMRAENIAKSFDDLVLFKDLSFELGAGDRLGITGPNGTGKTTLLKLALGRLDADAGTIRLGPNLKIGYLDQQAQTLNPDHTILDEARTARPELLPEAVRSRLGAFLFTGDDVFKRVGDLSGGQQNRLMLCKIVLSEPDILVLDEPTNHLDIASREMLEEALLDFNGTILAVSHDRYFLDRVADCLLVVGADAAGQRQTGHTDMIATAGTDTEGVYSTYARKIQEQLRRREQQRLTEKKQAASTAAAPKAKTPDHLRPFNKFTVEQLETQIHETEAVLEEMQQQFGDEAVYQSHEKMTRLQADVEAKQAHLALLYEAWEYRL